MKLEFWIFVMVLIALIAWGFSILSSRTAPKEKIPNNNLIQEVEMPDIETPERNYTDYENLQGK